MIRTMVLMPIRIYQYAISPFMAPHCRYHPTCSEYTVQAVTRFGALRGLSMGLRRISRCHPWAEGGYDPVPEKAPIHESRK